MRWSWHHLWLLGSVAWVTACGDPQDEPSTASTPLSSPSETASTTENTPLSPLPALPSERHEADLQGELTKLDPATDGWDTEVISARMLKDLKALEKWTQTDRQELLPLAMSPTFQGHLIASAPLTETYTHGSLQVARGRPAAFGPAVAWLSEWPSPSTTHFKLIQIAAEEGGVLKATVLVDRSASREDAPVQENMVWGTEWRLNANDELTLSQIKIAFVERIRWESDRPSLFADATGAVLDGDDAFEKQLRFGIDYWRERLDWRFGAEIVGPHGFAIGDANGDGWDDLYVCDTGGLPNALFLQQADGTARNVASEAGVDFHEPTHSALFVDWDNDGDQDLTIASGRHVFFYANDGNARFAQKAVAQSDSIVRSLAAADYNLDGKVDLYVCGYFDRNGDTVGLGRPLPYHDANNGVRNYLLENRDQWRFENVTESVGLDINNQRFSYAAAWEDADNDGDPDLYVANDFGRNNFYRNDGGQFTDVAGTLGVEDLSAGMSVSWGDYNQDGLMDLYVGNMFSSAGNRIAYQRQYRPGQESTHHAYRRHARGNTLFVNRGQDGFQDLTLPAGVNMGRWSWSCQFADVNNDSHLDLLVANGMVTSDEDSDDL